MISLKISEAQLVALGEITMVANTPYFLFDRMRKSEPVLEISRSHTSQELGDALRVAVAEKQEEAVVAAYAIIVALAVRGDADAMHILSSTSTESLRWGPSLITFALRELRPTQIVTEEIAMPIPSQVLVTGYSA